jgi:hypothetical protein
MVVDCSLFENFCQQRTNYSWHGFYRETNALLKMWMVCVGDDMVGIVQVTCMTIEDSFGNGHLGQTCMLRYCRNCTVQSFIEWRMCISLCSWSRNMNMISLMCTNFCFCFHFQLASAADIDLMMITLFHLTSLFQTMMKETIVQGFIQGDGGWEIFWCSIYIKNLKLELRRFPSEV